MKALSRLFAGIARWAVVAFVLVIGVGAAFALWFAQTTSEMSKDRTQQNNRDLAVMAANISSWPVSLEYLARSYFVPGKSTQTARSDPEHGIWQATTTVFHPVLGRIDYTLTGWKAGVESEQPWLPQACLKKLSAGISGSENSYRLVVSGPISLPGLIRSKEQEEYNKGEAGARFERVVGAELKEDLESAGPTATFGDGLSAKDIDKIKDARINDYTHFTQLVNDRFKPQNDKICFQTKVALDSIIPGGELGHFDRLLIADSTGRVLAQLGGPDLPVVDISQQIADPSTARAIENSAVATLNPALKTPPEQPRPLTKVSGPTSVHIGGVAYIAYVRPFRFDPGSFAATAPDAETSSAAASAQEQGELFAVGLIVEAEQRKAFFRLPPHIIVMFGIPLLFLVALVPVLKLRMIGSGEALGKIEVVALGAGVIACVGLATASLLFAWDLNALNHGDERVATDTAVKLAGQFGAEMRKAESPLDGKPAPASVEPPPTGAARCLSTPLDPDFTRALADGTVRDEHAFPALDDFGPAMSDVEVAEIAPWRDANPDMVIPPRETINLVDIRTGERAANSRSVACRGNAGTRFTVKDRSYFRDVIEGRLLDPADGDPSQNRVVWPRGASSLLIWPKYAIDVVRARTDGMTKVIVVHPAVDLTRTESDTDLGLTEKSSFDRDQPFPHCPRLNISPEKSAKENIDALRIVDLNSADQDCFNLVFLYAMINQTFLSPVIPDGMQYAVVNLDDPKLPVLFHSELSRAGFELFADSVQAPRLADALIRLRSRYAEPVLFDGQYDGLEQQFVATPLARTHWALLVFYPKALPDGQAAGALITALTAWSIWTLLWVVTAVLAVLVWTRLRDVFGAFARSRRHRSASPGPIWAQLWPRPADYRAHRRLAVRGFSLSAILLIASALLATNNRAQTVIMLLSTLGVCACVALAVMIARERPTAPADEAGLSKRHRVVVGALIASVVVGLAVVPVVACYLQAAEFGDRQADYASFDNQRAAEEARYRATVNIIRVLRPYESGPFIPPAAHKWIEDSLEGRRLYGFAPRNWSRIDRSRALDGGWIEWASRLFNPNLSPPRIKKCEAFPLATVFRDDQHVTAAGCNGTPGFSSANVLAGPLTPTSRLFGAVPPPSISVLLMLGLAFCGVLWVIGRTVAHRLLGFDVPIEIGPFEPPTLDGEQDLARSVRNLGTKVVIVDAPADLRDRLLESCRTIDLSTDPEPASPVVALAEVVLLHRLEITVHDGALRRRALQRIEQLCASPEVRLGRTQVILLSDVTPLDRVLQAYEEDIRLYGPALSSQDRQEAIDVRKTHEDLRWSKLFEDFKTFIYTSKDHLADYQSDNPAVTTMIDELSPLPEHVTRSLLPGRICDVIPAGDQAALSNAVAAWADARRAADPEAIVEFLSTMLVEHYRYIWTLSSRAERLVLVNLAHGRAISIPAAAEPLRSLVRRGLVRMDSGLHIMNRSFAAFIKTAETPAKLAEYQRSVTRGGWRVAQIPLLLFVPIGLVVLAYALLDSGLGVQSLAPLATMAAPALIQTFFGTRRVSG